MIDEHLPDLAELTSTKKACVLLGASRATCYRRRRPPIAATPPPRRRPPNALSEAEREGVLSVLRSEAYCDTAPAQVWNSVYSPAMNRAGVHCRFHDLRHTSVALAIAEGAHPKAIQTRMGHSSINVTLDRYGHLFPELDEALAQSFGKRLEAARGQLEGNNVVHGAFADER
ncbi:MAG: tyrosine-type recombinase/integrase [Acidimicrobiales bacterium]